MRELKGRDCISTSRRGTVAAFTALILVVLLGFTALGVDICWLVAAKAQLQASTDNCALATAHFIANQGFQSDGAARRAVSKAASSYGESFMPHNPVEGIEVTPDSVLTGRAIWDNNRVVGFRPDRWSYDAVRVVAIMSGDNQAGLSQELPAFFGSIFGVDTFQPSARAVALLRITGRGGSRFLIDDEVIDTDIPVIEDMAAALGITTDDLLADANGDWFIDIWDHCKNLPQPQGCQLELPTGQIGDEGLFDVDHSEFPFNESSAPSIIDFLNWQDDNSTWRYYTLGDPPSDFLDPLVGVSRVDDPSKYASYVDRDYVHISPVQKSDHSALNDIPIDALPDGNGIPAVNANGERRGLLAFKIIDVGSDPDGPGSVLPNLVFEFVDPSPYAGCFVQNPVGCNLPPPPDSSGGSIAVVGLGM